MYLDEFGCVVLGNEPAGLWLLQRLLGVPAEDGTPRTCAWLQLGESPIPRPLPYGVARTYGIEVDGPWHAEVVSRRRTLPWTKEALKEAFPALPEGLLDPDPLKTPNAAQLSALGKALRQHPELLSYAAGVWKGIGRTQRLQPEVLLWGALCAQQLAWWDAPRSLPPEVTRLEVSPIDNPLEEVKSLPQGGLSFKFAGLKPIVARRWILNLPYGRLLRLSSRCDTLLKQLSTDQDPRANRSLYRLTVEADAVAVPHPVRPLTAYFDTEVIPEWDTEIWPFSLQRDGDTVKLDLWVSAPTVGPVEAVLERMRAAVGRINHLFPFLPLSTRHYSVPLDVDTCHDEQWRLKTDRLLEARSHELYDHTSFQTQTRHRALVALFPSLHCHLPGATGPLMGADKVFGEILGKQGRRQTESRESTAPPSAP